MSKNGASVALVTGGAGFVAFHLIERLLKEGRRIVAVDNFDPFYPRRLKETNLADLRSVARASGGSLEFRELDVCELEPADFADLGIGTVFHLAAKAGVRPSLEDPESYLLANVLGTERVLALCRALAIPRLVFASSSSVYGDDTPAPFSEEFAAVKPVSPYAASKRCGELWCEAWAHLFGVRVAALRFFTVYGPRQRPDLAIHHFAARMIAGESITLFGDGSTSRDYTYVADIVEGILSAERWLATAAAGRCEIFNLGGSRPTTLIDLVGYLEEALGVEAHLLWAPQQPGDVLTTWADIGKARRMLGFEPRVGIGEGIRRFVEWYWTVVPGGRSARAGRGGQALSA